MRYDDFFSAILEEYVKTGKMEPGLVKADLINGGSGLKYSPEIGDRIPEDVKKQIEEIEKKIISGDIKVPTTEEEYNAFVSGL